MLNVEFTTGTTLNASNFRFKLPPTAEHPTCSVINSNDLDLIHAGNQNDLFSYYCIKEDGTKHCSYECVCCLYVYACLPLLYFVVLGLINNRQLISKKFLIFFHIRWINWSINQMRAFKKFVSLAFVSVNLWITKHLKIIFQMATGSWSYMNHIHSSQLLNLNDITPAK